MVIDQFPAIILALLAAGVSGLVGAFALMKRTILAGDVMSHIAIPGIGLAVVWKLNPILGGALTLFLGILIIWRLQEKSNLTTEAAIGVIFASSVAIGALLIESPEELIDVLFGGFGKVTAGEFIFGAAVGAGVILALSRLRHELILSLFSPDLAAAAGVKVSRVNLWFLLLFGLAILVSLRFLGALLVGSLIIIPASAARQLTHSLGKFLTLSAALAMLAMLLGLFLAKNYGLEPGPTVVIAAAIIFLLSLLKPKK
jgi:zinc transport system permease protein